MLSREIRMGCPGGRASPDSGRKSCGNARSQSSLRRNENNPIGHIGADGDGPGRTKNILEYIRIYIAVSNDRRPRRGPSSVEKFQGPVGHNGISSGQTLRLQHLSRIILPAYWSPGSSATVRDLIFAICPAKVRTEQI